MNTDIQAGKNVICFKNTWCGGLEMGTWGHIVVTGRAHAAWL